MNVEAGPADDAEDKVNPGDEDCLTGHEISKVIPEVASLET